MMLPCKVWIPDPAGKYLGDGNLMNGWVAQFDGSSAFVVLEDGSLGRFEIPSVSIRMDVAREAGLIPPGPALKPFEPVTKASGRAPNPFTRSEVE